jgi:hypothetical protein
VITHKDNKTAQRYRSARRRQQPDSTPSMSLPTALNFVDFVRNLWYLANDFSRFPFFPGKIVSDKPADGRT